MSSFKKEKKTIPDLSNLLCLVFKIFKKGDHNIKNIANMI